ncbi:MAG TPA: periplasmic heavy metal sensor [Anaeromyxobacteraceae bacterium]|nr:periplasmic heavy metal sensor [Anaeromyxobacteraceae bacterium]
MKKSLLLLLALPLAALAQPAAGPARGTGQGQGPSPEKAERMERRASLAFVLGLSEALDLDSAQALKLRETVARFQDRRIAAHKALAEARQALREIARTGKGDAKQVDEALKKAQDSSAQLDAVRREAFAAISKDLAPEQKARAWLFLSRFEDRFGPGMGRHRGGPGGGRGMGPGMGGGMGMMMGPGMGPGPAMDCPNPGCPWHGDDDR